MKSSEIEAAAQQAVNKIASDVTATEFSDFQVVKNYDLSVDGPAAKGFKKMVAIITTEFSALAEAEDNVEAALVKLRERYPNGFCEIMFSTESGTEKNYLASAVIAVWDSSRSSELLTHYDAPTLAEALSAAMEGE